LGGNGWVRRGGETEVDAFGEDALGYLKLFELLGGPVDTIIAMEATGHYWKNLFAALVARGFSVALLNPLRTRRFAEEDLERTKTDSIDALGIARIRCSSSRPWMGKAIGKSRTEPRQPPRISPAPGVSLATVRYEEWERSRSREGGPSDPSLTNASPRSGGPPRSAFYRASPGERAQRPSPLASSP
jgi:Transposase